MPDRWRNDFTRLEKLEEKLEPLSGQPFDPAASCDGSWPRTGGTDPLPRGGWDSGPGGGGTGDRDLHGERGRQRHRAGRRHRGGGIRGELTPWPPPGPCAAPPKCRRRTWWPGIAWRSLADICIYTNRQYLDPRAGLTGWVRAEPGRSLGVHAGGQIPPPRAGGGDAPAGGGRKTPGGQRGLAWTKLTPAEIGGGAGPLYIVGQNDAKKARLAIAPCGNRWRRQEGGTRTSGTRSSPTI